MNVLILMPKIPVGQEYMFPLGIACVSAALKKSGYNVFTMNLNFYDDWQKELYSYIENNNIEIVGTGGLTADYHQINQILEYIDVSFPKVIKVLGGGIVTASTHIIFEMFPCLDIAMQGEGEIAWVELMNALENQKELSEVPNLIYRNGNELIMTRVAKDIENLDELPFPDYDGFGYFEAMKHMEKTGYWIGNMPAFVLSSRSCPYQCTFCFHTAGKKYRRASLNYVFKQIDHMIENYKCHDFDFSDELFGLDEQYVLDFCEQIEKRKVNWSVSMRVDCITPRMAERMAATGCKWILYGIESADDRILKSMNKKITQSQINTALDITRKNNIGVIGYLIFGDPEENYKSVETSLKWWLENLKYGIGMNMIKAFPGSLNYDKCVASGKITSEIDFIKKGCPVINTTKLSDDEYFGVYARIEGYKMYYLYSPQEITLTDYIVKKNQFVFKYICPHCGKENYSMASFYQNKHLICDECNQVMHVVIARYFQEITTKTYIQLFEKEKSILLHTDDESSYQCAFALTESGYKVFIKSGGRNLYEHRPLWGVETIFESEVEGLKQNNSIIELNKADSVYCIDNLILQKFIEEYQRKNNYIKLTDEGENYEYIDKRNLGISGQSS